jgi:hypothetical protein
MSWSPGGVRLHILEELQQPSRQLRVQARVDLIEQQHLATSQRGQRRPDQREPRLRARRLLTEVEGEFLSLDAVYEPQSSWLRQIPLLDDLHIVDAEVREPEEGKS